MKRYDLVFHCEDDESTMDEDPDGRWVRWEDVEALLLVCDEARALLAEIGKGRPEKAVKEDDAP